MRVQGLGFRGSGIEGLGVRILGFRGLGPSTGGDSDFRKLSITLIVTWFPFPLLGGKRRGVRVASLCSVSILELDHAREVMKPSILRRRMPPQRLLFSSSIPGFNPQCGHGILVGSRYIFNSTRKSLRRSSRLHTDIKSPPRIWKPVS